jgi:EpsD family peptidyl-prolyl cis-trans isomerase
MSAIARSCTAFVLSWFCVTGLLAQQQPPRPAQPQAAPPAAVKPLATVNGVAIKRATFDHALKQALAQGNPDSPQLRQALASQLIARELFAQEAARQGLDKDPEVIEIVEETRRSALAQRYLREQIRLNPVTEEQIRAYYDQVKSGHGSKEYKLRVLMLPSEQRAKELRDQLAKGKDFAELAQQWSLAPSASRGGELDWVSFKTPAREGETQGLPLPIAQTLEKMQKGRVSEPIQVKDRWWLVKLEDTRAARVPSYEDAKPGIQRMLNAREIERATGELAAKLAKSATIVQ